MGSEQEVKTLVKHILRLALFVYYWIDCAIRDTLCIVQGNEREPYTRDGVEIGRTNFVWRYARVVALLYSNYWFRNA